MKTKTYSFIRVSGETMKELKEIRKRTGLPMIAIVARLLPSKTQKKFVNPDI